VPAKRSHSAAAQGGMQAYMKIAIDHQDNAGERYHSVSAVEAASPAVTVEARLPS